MNRYGKVREDLVGDDKLLRTRRTRLGYVAVLPVMFILGFFVGSSVQRSIYGGKSLRETISSASSSSSYQRPSTSDDADLDWTSCSGHGGCCIVHGPSDWKEHKISDVRIGKKTWHLATHASDDIVSNFVNSGTVWDQKKVALLIKDLRILSASGSKPAVFVDVGANIGWFSFIAANYGYKVLAFEPFRENLARFNHSLCLNDDEVRKRVTLFPFALGTRDGITCEQWATPTNHGNAITVCDSDESLRVKKMLDISGHDYLGRIQMRRLDEIMGDDYLGIAAGESVVMKIDTEGFEAAVIMGARKFFGNAGTKPKVVYSEFCRQFISKAGLSMGMNREEAMKLPDTYLNDMKTLGYTVDPVPLNKSSAIQDLVFRLSIARR